VKFKKNARIHGRFHLAQRDITSNGGVRAFFGFAFMKTSDI
jgi:hypothetical protein